MNNSTVKIGQTVRFRFKRASPRRDGLKDCVDAIVSCVASDTLTVPEWRSRNGLAIIRQTGCGHEYFYYKVGNVLPVASHDILEDLWVCQGDQDVPLVHYRPFR